MYRSLYMQTIFDQRGLEGVQRSCVQLQKGRKASSMPESSKNRRAFLSSWYVGGCFRKAHSWLKCLLCLIMLNRSSSSHFLCRQIVYHHFVSWGRDASRIGRGSRVSSGTVRLEKTIDGRFQYHARVGKRLRKGNLATMRGRATPQR